MNIINTYMAKFVINNESLLYDKNKERITGKNKKQSMTVIFQSMSGPVH